MKPSLPHTVLIGLMYLVSCTSINAQSKSIDDTELQVLSSIVLADSIPGVYFKTTVSELNQPLSRYLFYLKDFDICNSLVNMDSMRLDTEEINYLVERFANMEIAKINKLVREPKNHTLKQLKGSSWSVISLPVVFRDGEYAIYYSKGAFGGQFILLKYIEGAWKDVCYSSVYVE